MLCNGILSVYTLLLCSVFLEFIIYILVYYIWY